MRRLAAARLPLTAVWLTRGGLHGERREAESRRAMELLGVDPRNLFCFRLPDGHALDFMDDIVVRLARLFERLQPASVFVPAFEGGHPDHDAAQLAAAVALGRIGWERRVADQDGELTAERRQTRRPILYEFPLYHRADARLLKVGEFIPGTTSIEQTSIKLKDRLLKRKLAVTFRSQRVIIWPLMGLKGGPMMVHLKGEPYRQVPGDRDYTVRPHPGRLAYEYYTPVRFPHFAEVAARVMRRG